MNQEFEFGPIKIMQDDDGYGIAQLISDEPKQWEVVASFKYLNEFIRFFCKHLERELDRDESYKHALALNQSILQTQQFNEEEDSNG